MGRVVLLACISLILTGCGISGDFSTSFPSPFNLSSFNSNKDDWDRSRSEFSSYQITISKNCNCTSPASITTSVDENDQETLLRAEDELGNEITGYSLSSEDVASVEDLFSKMEEMVRSADKVDVIYDETFGYPKQLDIDMDENIAGDEISFTVDAFQVL